MLNVLGHDGDVDGHGLDGALVGSPADPEEALLAPVGLAPRVLHRPELLAGAGLDAVAHQQHGVGHHLSEGSVLSAMLSVS